jgi:alkanesulfonate monooxygenase SsuD/methylene tetrahydromethanopterin reductase-like flavin-dependent oxidoreductase (luciferase family)
LHPSSCRSPNLATRRSSDEFLRALKAIWTTDPVEFHGDYYHVPRSIIGPKPSQKPHPPIYLAAFAPAALRRVGMLADGWNPVGLPMETMAQMPIQLREMAQEAGRDPTALEVIVRANLLITPQPLGADRWIFSGSLAEASPQIF